MKIWYGITDTIAGKVFSEEVQKAIRTIDKGGVTYYVAPVLDMSESGGIDWMDGQQGLFKYVLSETQYQFWATQENSNNLFSTVLNISDTEAATYVLNTYQTPVYVEIDPATPIESLSVVINEKMFDGQNVQFAAGGTIEDGIVVQVFSLALPQGMTLAGAVPTVIDSGDVITFKYNKTKNRLRRIM